MTDQAKRPLSEPGKRAYGQFCGLAAALDVLGERWSVLVVRELLIRPARFNEIARNLPGVGPGLLAERLRSLTERGVVEVAAVPGDGRGKLYRLTPVGERLRAPVLQLARWGMGFLTEEDVNGAVRDAWGFLAVQAMFEGSPVPDVTEEYEFRVGEGVFHVRLDGGVARAHDGPAAEPVIVVESDAVTFVQVGAQMVSSFEAVATGKVRIQGPTEAVMRCAALMGLSPPAGGLG